MARLTIAESGVQFFSCSCGWSGYVPLGEDLGPCCPGCGEEWDEVEAYDAQGNRLGTAKRILDTDIPLKDGQVAT